MLVVKIGGGEGIDYDAILSDISSMEEKIVIVHGGNAELDKLSKAVGKEQRMLRFASGHVSRYTDKETIELFEMVYCGKINKMIVQKLQKLGKNAVGLSGLDGGLLRGKRKDTLLAELDGKRRVIRDDLTGKIETVNGEFLHMLLDNNFLPVISPPALSRENEAINVDGDRAAAMIAATLKAETLVILTNVPGLLKDPEDESTLIKQARGLTEIEDFAKGRMKIKLLGASEALEGGVGRVILADARIDQPVTKALAGEGTVITHS